VYHREVLTRKYFTYQTLRVFTYEVNYYKEKAEGPETQRCLMDMRELKGLEIAAWCKLAFRRGAWHVPSQSGNGTYRDTLSPDSCECEDFALRALPCKHVHAARLVQEGDHGGKSPIIADTPPKKPTYKQNWAIYNQAQHQE
jgi:hypothetical protein